MDVKEVGGGVEEVEKEAVVSTGEQEAKNSNGSESKQLSKKRKKNAALAAAREAGAAGTIAKPPKPLYKARYELEKLNQRQLVELVMQHQAASDPVRHAEVEIIRTRKTSTRDLDWEKYSVRHIALKVAYLGWDFLGLAMQVETANTIEGVLADAMIKVKMIQSVSDCNWSRAGRTDKGVSGLGQVIALHVRSNVKSGLGVVSVGSGLKEDGEEFDFVTMLNACLPDEIRVLGWTPVPLDFSARFSAVSRTYKYFFIKEDLNIDAMRQGLSHLLGNHNFRNFCKMDVANVSHFNRRVISGSIAPVAPSVPEYNPNVKHPLGVEANQSSQNWDAVWEFTITGTAFLWHQVRYMVSMLFTIGRGLEKPEIIKDLLDISKYPQKPLFPMASEVPLILYDVAYDGIEFEVNAQAQRKIQQSIFSYWANREIKAQMARLLITNLDNSNINITYAPVEVEEKKSAQKMEIDSRSFARVQLIDPHAQTPGQPKQQPKKDIRTLHWVPVKKDTRPETEKWGAIKDQVMAVYHPRYWHIPVESRDLEGMLQFEILIPTHIFSLELRKIDFEIFPFRNVSFSPF